MTEEQYESYEEYLEEEKKNYYAFLQTIPVHEVVDYLITFDNWSQYIPHRQLSDYAIASQLDLDNVNGVAYILRYQFPEVAKELAKELNQYKHKRIINADIA